MKRMIVFTVLSLSASILFAHENILFHKHEIRVAFGDATVTSEIRLERNVKYNNFSFSYYYRPKNFFWVGANFMNYVGEKTYYQWREYDTNGSFQDFSKSKRKYCAIIAPEIRFSFLNRKAIILYGALSGGIGWENGYDTKWEKYPKTLFPCFHFNYFGLSSNFGKNNNIFLGGELGIGFKGLGSIHAGYRF